MCFGMGMRMRSDGRCLCICSGMRMRMRSDGEACVGLLQNESENGIGWGVFALPQNENENEIRSGGVFAFASE